MCVRPLARDEARQIDIGLRAGRGRLGRGFERGVAGEVLLGALEGVAHGAAHQGVLDAALVETLQDLDGGAEVLLRAL